MEEFADLREANIARTLSYLALYKSKILRDLVSDPKGTIAKFYVHKYMISTGATSDYIPMDKLDPFCLLDVKEGSGLVPSWHKSTQIAGGKVGSIFVLDWLGRKFVLKRSPVSPSIKLDSAVAKHPPLSEACLFPNTPEKFVSSDEFTNETLVAFFLESFFGSKEGGMYRPNVVYLGAFICENQGFDLLEYYSWGNVASFSRNKDTAAYRMDISYLQQHKLTTINIVRPKFVVEIMKQVTVGIWLMQVKTQFISGDCKVANVFMTDVPVDDNISGIRLNAPFTCRIADYGKSSITVLLGEDKQPHRFYTPKQGAGLYSMARTVFPLVVGEEGSKSYVLPSGPALASFLIGVRHAGFPFYQSIDIYTFIVSMLMVPAYYYAIMTDTLFREIFWEVLWNEEEVDTASRLLFEAMIAGTEPSFYNTANLLVKGGLHLFCDGLQRLLGKISTTQSEVARRTL